MAMPSGARPQSRVEADTCSQRLAILVDPDPQLSHSLAEVLQAEDWAIIHAMDNLQVLALASSRPVDLIITGEKTSGREDVDLLRNLRRVRPHCRLIILTDESTPADVIASIRERAFSYFSKPFSLDSLVDMVHKVVDAPNWNDGIEVLSATPEWIQLLVRCDLQTAERLSQFMLEIADLPEPEKHNVAIAFREMLMNAIEHGGKFDATQKAEFSYVRAKHAVMCRIKDPGKGFAMSEMSHAAVNNPADDPLRHLSAREDQNMRPGGYGILLARQMVDELIYGEKGNEVLLIKYLNPQTAQDSPDVQKNQNENGD